MISIIDVIINETKKHAKKIIKSDKEVTINSLHFGRHKNKLNNLDYQGIVKKSMFFWHEKFRLEFGES